MSKLGQCVGKTACADIVNAQYWISVTQCPACIDHFLATPLHLRIGALYRIEVERFAVGAGSHRRGRAAAEPDAHARAADLQQQRAWRQHFLVRVRSRDIAKSAGDHDRLVVSPDNLTVMLLVGAEIAGEVDAPEFVVERSTTERPVDHDLQGRRDTRRLSVIIFPGPEMAGNLQV